MHLFAKNLHVFARNILDVFFFVVMWLSPKAKASFDKAYILFEKPNFDAFTYMSMDVRVIIAVCYFHSRISLPPNLTWNDVCYSNTLVLNVW